MMSVHKISEIINNNKNIIIKPFGNLFLAKYSKGNTLITKEVGNIRSVVCSDPSIPENFTVYSISPTKSMDYSEFIEKYPHLNENIIVEEFIEGTMINVFWADKKWNISTKSNIGAKNNFFGDTTFDILFQEACHLAKLDIELLDKNVSYSFVLQHPKNRIVTEFYVPLLWLIEAYHITTSSIYPLNVQSIVKSHNNSYLHIPKKFYHFMSYDQMYQFFTDKTIPYQIMGCIIRNTVTNERTKIRNPHYEYVRRLRGNQPKLQYRYYELMQENNIPHFLDYYPEYQTEFLVFQEEIGHFVDTLFRHYKQCYIRKEKPLSEFPYQYKKHMFNIHDKYKTLLKPYGKYINYEDVYQYFIKLHPSIIMWGINYENYHK